MATAQGSTRGRLRPKHSMEAVEILEVRSWDVHNVLDPSTVDELINLPCRDSFYGPFLVKLGMAFH